MRTPTRRSSTSIRAGPVQPQAEVRRRTSRAAGQTPPDGKIWTFHTQPNAKWSDGKPLTAADAAWTYSTILKFQNGATANSAGYVAHMKSAHRAERDHPGADLLSRPVANVLSQVQQVPILPEHIWAKYATGNGKALKTFQNNAPSSPAGRSS